MAFIGIDTSNFSAFEMKLSKLSWGNLQQTQVQLFKCYLLQFPEKKNASHFTMIQKYIQR